ncbi:MAG TPA: RNA-binding protein [Myxococcota bacterium]|nr:RNA-binding protein [Myxococcota bacterium]
MSKKLYVGNLPFTTSEAELRRLFEPHGGVDSVSVVMDRETGRPRGFAFVEMSDASGASEAISRLDGHSLEGRALRVNEANDRSATSRSGFAGGQR